jgi:hypothetical protein
MSEFVFSAHGVPNPQQANKPPDPPKHTTPKISFRDKLLGPSQEIPVREKQDMIENKLVRIELENGNRLLPKVYIDPTTFNELCTPWKDALVVKLLGKTLSYHSMKDRLQKVWKPQSGFEIMDNGNGFYMVKFDQAADKEKVVTGGPWMIFDHCLAVTHWSPEFASPEAKVERTVVWVRFPGLNLVYYDESFLLAMASAIGRPIKVDSNTLKVERGRFARVCVEVDLTVPVVGKIWVNGHWYKVQYEGLHLICTNCGCYGHLGRNCPQTPTSSATTSPPAPRNHDGTQQLPPKNSTQEPVINGASNGKNSSCNQNHSTAINGEIISIDDGAKDLHGDWLLVTRRKKASNNSNFNNPKTDKPKTNRFSSLSNLAHQGESSLLPPKPKPSDTQRTNRSSFEPKRRRQDSNEEKIMNHSLKATSNSHNDTTNHMNSQTDPTFPNNSITIIDPITASTHLAKSIPLYNINTSHPLTQNTFAPLHDTIYSSATTPSNPPQNHVLTNEDPNTPLVIDTEHANKDRQVEPNIPQDGVLHLDEDMDT